jgi:hypothetical protein
MFPTLNYEEDLGFDPLKKPSKEICARSAPPVMQKGRCPIANQI